MTQGIAGDDVANPTNTTAGVDNVAGTAMQETGLGLVGPAGTLDRAREDIPGRILTADADVLALILQELRVMNALLCEGLNITTDPEMYRAGIDQPLN